MIKHGIKVKHGTERLAFNLKIGNGFGPRLKWCAITVGDHCRFCRFGFGLLGLYKWAF